MSAPTRTKPNRYSSDGSHELMQAMIGPLSGLGGFAESVVRKEKWLGRNKIFAVFELLRESLASRRAYGCATAT